MADSYEFMIRRVVGDPRAGGLSVCRTLYDLVSGAMRYRHGAQEGIYDEHGNPRVAIVRKIKAINSALHDYVMHPHSDADLAEYETRFPRSDSVVETAGNGRQCVAVRVYPGRPDSKGVSLLSRGQESIVLSLDCWQMKRIYE